MGGLSPYLSACMLALLSHLFFNTYPPTGVRFVVPALILEPAFILGFYGLSPVPRLVLSLYVCFFLSLGASICLYRLSPLHPLGHVPGPILAKVTMLHHAYIVYHGHRHEFFKKLHERHGPIVRTGPNEISVNDVEAVKSVLGKLPKGSYYTTRDPPGGGGAMVILNGEPHGIRRRRWDRGLNTQSLKDYQDSLTLRTNELLEHMSSRSGKPVDFAAWMDFLVLDFLGDMAFGGGINMMSNPNADQDPFWGILKRYSITMVTICQLPWAYSFCTKLPIISRNLMDINAFGMSKARARIERGTTTKDLWFHLMNQAGADKIPPSYSEMVGDGSLAIVAGSDTSHYQRIQEEIDKVALTETQTNEGGITQAMFPYTAACINEALRLYPPVPTNGPRIVPPGNGGHVVANMLVPEGTQIYVPPYVLHRNFLYFSDPDTFQPERWLDHLAPGAVLNRDAFIPFSYGVANCAAKNLALREMLTFTTSLLQKFDIRFAPGFDYREWPKGIHDFYITTRPPLPVIFTPR